MGFLLFRTMFREELRLHRSFIGSIGSAFFPAMIFVLALVLAVSFPRLGALDVPTALLLLHAGAVLYGLSVGALGRIGEEAMSRRMGQVNFLLRLPELQPVRFRTVMAAFYAKDAVYYIFYAIVPIVAAIGIAAPFAGASLWSVGLLGITILLAFLLGMSLSFLASVLSTRSRTGAAVAGVLALAVLVLVWQGVVSVGLVVWPLGFWAGRDPAYLAASAGLVLLLSAAAVALTKERHEAPTRTFASVLLPTEQRFAFVGRRRTLVAKEWLELRRSGTLGAVVGGFLGPLVAVYALAWIFRSAVGVPIEFNVVFYGVMVGFLGTMVYSWITNLEPNEFLNVQPVTLDEVIKGKLVLYFLLTTGISYAYVIVIAAVTGQVDLLPLALLVAAATTVYVAGVTARLTGIWTNTMLFDARVLAKFAGAVVPPLVLVAIASFLVRSDALVAAVLVVAVSAVLLAASRVLFRGVETRWRQEHFSFAGREAANP